MEALQKKAQELLTTCRANVVIGYGQGSDDKPRAIFVTDPAGADKLIFNDTCKQNLGVYLMKAEVKKLGKMGIFATKPVMRTVVLLASENQLTDIDVTVIGVNEDGSLVDFENLQALENHVKTITFEPDPADKAKIEAIEKMTVEERWAYWQDQLSKCFKCYACRSACPMCYCSRCTVECNQPQWIPVPSHHLGNFEWHMMRAMHLVGRCIECGECGRACPLDLPVHLLTQKMAADARKDFGWQAGMSLKLENPLSSFKPDDKESFIK